MPSTAPSRPSRQLETFPNPAPARDFRIHMEIPEFTCLCPKTGQPDFATLVLDYVPDRLCVELKSLKLYAWSYRDEGAFHEALNMAAIERARTSGAITVDLTSRPSREAANRLYQRIGFVKRDTNVYRYEL